MRWFVTGAHGMLGQDLCDVLEAAGHEVTRRDLPQLDILDAPGCLEQIAGHDVVANCAAHTAVDRAEEEEGLAFAINAVGAANLARAAAAAGGSMVQISTDYVFAGDATVPYAADAPPVPASAYGRTKAAGEWAVRAECPQSWIVRTAWLYGAAGQTGFPKVMKRLAATRETLTVVDDQVGGSLRAAHVDVRPGEVGNHVGQGQAGMRGRHPGRGRRRLRPPRRTGWRADLGLLARPRLERR